MDCSLGGEFLFLRRMKNQIILLFTFSMTLLIGMGCAKELTKYNQWSRKGTLAEKDSAAFFFFERGDYEKASFLFEELQGAYRGDTRARTILYHYAYAKYHTGLYVVAAYYFENYTQLYPNDEKAAECLFMVAYCYFLESAPHYLDQEFTLKGIQQLQLFINTYPRNEKVSEANDLMRELRERLARKAFENAKQYYNLGDYNYTNYRAAVTALEVMIQEYPDSRYREEAQFLRFKSAAALAEVSIGRRKKNRYLDALDIYQEFVDRYPASVYLKEAEDIFVKAKKNLGKILAEEEEESGS